MENSGLDLMGREKEESVFCSEEENHPQLWDNIEESKSIMNNRRNFLLKRSIFKRFFFLLCVKSSSSPVDV